MTYQIQVSSNTKDDFVKIIQSLQNIGVVENFQESKSWALEGSELSEKELLAALKEREQEIAEGQFFTTTELRKFLKVWRQMGKR
ncbi:MAG: hypothetical protein AAF806_20170 [Bacteroidota bacterium]